MRINSFEPINRRERRKVIALTGASGYIGSHLLKRLEEDADIIAISRNTDASKNCSQVEWRSCDFFSQEQALEALRGADIAFYLIHSMLPSAKLTQGSFEDMDAILAAHFARAAAQNGIRQIIYLSGMIPAGLPENDLSRHLRSRLEVERILGSFGVPVTTIRAGLIVGPEGSSYPILSKLVRRLPIMVMPSWTRTKTHPVALTDVLDALTASIGRAEVMGRFIDVGGPDIMSYGQLLRETGELMGLKRIMIPFPFPTIKLSRLWISLITGAPKAISYPLVESLAHPMVASKENEVDGISKGSISYREAAKQALEQEMKKQKAQAHSSQSPLAQEQADSSPNSEPAISKKLKALKSDVRSVQRFTLPPGKNADWAGKHYVNWLSNAFKPFIYAEHAENEIIRIRVRPLRKPVLELSYARELSSAHRSVYRITGGCFALTAEAPDGRLEFTQLPESQDCLAAIHDYMPALPWLLYKYGQAKIHLIVMYAYGRRLKRLASNRPMKSK
ncbi:NAD(P)H-binding protein [Paenibacillus herberti]|uniref:NmrA family protein n=1 Tax=Paenibacillus herberti TaxID=1619309 RepID=A0A229P2W3_9BACL|nr:NAD(P)H-binding protein [Paenibacillus herberti]OXM16209.1 NmrA family protein [Paenibacillus herberti]